MLIDQGRMLYQGPIGDAKAYFQGLGYHCPDRQTTPDFLTACTDPVERRLEPGHQGPIPKGPIELEKAFLESPQYQKILSDVEAYENEIKENNMADARQFKDSVHETKSKTVARSSNYTVSFVRQVLSCTKREFWLTLGDLMTLKTKMFIIVSNALIVGSLFYGQSQDTSGVFSRSGVLFMSVIFVGWVQMGELMKAVSGRVVTARHRDYALYRPSAVVVARVLQDLPMIFMMIVPFTVIMVRKPLQPSY